LFHFISVTFVSYLASFKNHQSVCPTILWLKAKAGQVVELIFTTGNYNYHKAH